MRLKFFWAVAEGVVAGSLLAIGGGVWILWGFMAAALPVAGAYALVARRTMHEARLESESHYSEEFLTWLNSPQ